MKLISGDTKCVEFGLRRAQGPNGSLTASKYAMLGGFDGTSNVQAGYNYGLPIVGTLAHSMIMSFETEEDCADSRIVPPKDGGEPVDILKAALAYREKLGWHSTQLRELYAFVSFGFAFPATYSALVDSYSTKESGVKNFLLVSLVLQDLGYSPLSIRLDSGNLAELSIFAKNLFKEVGDQLGRDFSHVKVVASNDINEKTIRSLIGNKHQIDVFGIGTNLVTCQAQPALGMVYKVCEFRGLPRIKFSEEKEKTTIPGSKKILRAFNKENRPEFDVLCLESEVISEGNLKVFDRITGQEHTAHRVETLSQKLFANGKTCLNESQSSFIN